MWYGLHQAKKRANKHRYCIERGARESRKQTGVHIVACDSSISAYGIKNYWFGRTICIGVQLLTFPLWEHSFSSGSLNMRLTDSHRPISSLQARDSKSILSSRPYFYPGPGSSKKSPKSYFSLSIYISCRRSSHSRIPKQWSYKLTIRT